LSIAVTTVHVGFTLHFDDNDYRNTAGSFNFFNVDVEFAWDDIIIFTTTQIKATSTNFLSTKEMFISSVASSDWKMDLASAASGFRTTGVFTRYLLP
jgi:hypothetical protein